MFYVIISDFKCSSPIIIVFDALDECGTAATWQDIPMQYGWWQFLQMENNLYLGPGIEAFDCGIQTQAPIFRNLDGTRIG